LVEHGKLAKVYATMVRSITSCGSRGQRHVPQEKANTKTKTTTTAQQQQRQQTG